MSGRPAIFLDRDGVLNELVPDPETSNGESPLHIADVRLIEGAATTAAELHEQGYLLVCITNQPAAAKGTITQADLLAIHDRVIRLLADEGVPFDATRICLHHPDGVVALLSGPCDCRKPAAGMLLGAAKELDIDLDRSWMIGDTDVDVSAGQASGCRTILVENPASTHKRFGKVQPDYCVPDLRSALHILPTLTIDKSDGTCTC